MEFNLGQNVFEVFLRENRPTATDGLFGQVCVAHNQIRIRYADRHFFFFKRKKLAIFIQFDRTKVFAPGNL